MKKLIQILVLLLLLSVLKAELIKQFVVKIENYIKRLEDATIINIKCNQTVQQTIDIMTDKADKDAVMVEIERLNPTITAQETRIEELSNAVSTRDTRIEELNTTVTAQEAEISGQNTTIQALITALTVMQNNQNGKLNIGRLWKASLHGKFFESQGMSLKVCRVSANRGFQNPVLSCYFGPKAMTPFYFTLS